MVPNDQNWIIQGVLGPDGLPVKLDARLSSGSAVDFSEASIVVRPVRFSGQIALRDQYTAARDYTAPRPDYGLLAVTLGMAAPSRTMAAGSSWACARRS